MPAEAKVHRVDIGIVEGLVRKFRDCTLAYMGMIYAMLYIRTPFLVLQLINVLQDGRGP